MLLAMPWPILTCPCAARELHVSLWLQWAQHFTRDGPNLRLCVATFCSQATIKQPLLEPTLSLELGQFGATAHAVTRRGLLGS